MKKYLIFIILITISIILSYCSSSRRITASEPVKLSFDPTIKHTIETNCSPCHIPAKGGNKTAFDNYTNVSANIDEIIRRIQLKPGEKGFMPFRKSQPLPDSIVAEFKKWKTDGLIEKVKGER